MKLSKSNRISRCCVCKKIKSLGKWVSNIGIVEPNVEDFGCYYSDGYCPDCFRKVEKEIKKINKEVKNEIQHSKS